MLKVLKIPTQKGRALMQMNRVVPQSKRELLYKLIIWWTDNWNRRRKTI